MTTSRDSVGQGTPQASDQAPERGSSMSSAQRIGVNPRTPSTTPLQQRIGSSTSSAQRVGVYPRTPSTTLAQQRGVKRVLSPAEEPRKKLKYLNVLKVHILLPNATSVDIILDLGVDNNMEAFIRKIREASCGSSSAQSRNRRVSRDVCWTGTITVETLAGEAVDFEYLINLAEKSATTSATFLLLDGVDKESAWVDENLWNVTPKPEMLQQLPQGYTLETALADQVDNALQAVWGNADRNERRLVSVDLSNDKISIFDTGAGMDSSQTNSIANWGTVGGSTHRNVHHKGVGGEPPYLKPFLGKYGAGAVAAAMHLGGCVTVYSKTRKSKKVVTLKLEHSSLVQKHKLDSEQGIWRTPGELRDMTKEERERAPHGSFTKVVISKLKSQYCIKGSSQYWKVEKVKQLLKDIYFPYIQSESASRTVTPVEFEVNGTNLLEVVNCEMAIANQHTCIGAPFVFSIHMKKEPDDGFAEQELSDEANARITCQYFPIQRGKEALKTVLEEISQLRPGPPVTFETMHRVVVRWLGRLLPEAKWNILPFMEVIPKKEQRFHVRQQWAKRVRAYVETDAGFQPNQSKLELDRDHAFTLVLKNLGADNTTGSTEAEVHVDIKIAGRNKPVTSAELIEAYLAWLRSMHSEYDEEATFLDEPRWLINYPNTGPELGIYNKPAIIFHKRLKDTSGHWYLDEESPVRVKFHRGAGSLKSDLYATLEFFYREADDEHGELKILYRAIDVEESAGCKLIENTFQLNKSQWIPGSALSGGKCQRVEPALWRRKVEELLNKAPGYIDILGEEDLKKFNLEGAFPSTGSKLEAGYKVPPEVYICVRPRKGTGAPHKQGMVVSEPIPVILTVTHCTCTGPSCRTNLRKSVASPATEDHARVICTMSQNKTAVTTTGVKGLYTFNIGSTTASQLTQQGTYTFQFSLEGEKFKFVKTASTTMRIVPSKKTSKWRLYAQANGTSSALDSLTIRLGEKCTSDLILRKFDEYDNPQNFDGPMSVDIKIVTPNGKDLGMVQTLVAHPGLSEGRQQGEGLQIQGLLFSSGQLKGIESSYDALLRVCISDEDYGEMSCKVFPGRLASIRVKDSVPTISTCPGTHGSQTMDKSGRLSQAKELMSFDQHFRPREIIKKLTLQGLDASGNEIDKDQKMQVKVDGLEFQDSYTEEREVDDTGCVHLGGLLQVTAQHNSQGSVRVLSRDGKNICCISFKTVTRKLIATQVPGKSFIGRHIKDVTVKIVDQNGEVDVAVDGFSNALSVDWQPGVVFPFIKGECILPPIRLPDKPGWWNGSVRFSANESLSLELKVELELSEGCRLRNPASSSEGTLIARSGSIIKFPFVVVDDQEYPGLLPDSSKESITVEADMELRGEEETYSRPCKASCSNIAKSDKDGTGYKGDVILTGESGLYTIIMVDSSKRLKGEVRYKCKLNPGTVSQLVLQIHHSETRQQSGQKEVRIPVDESFPKITATLLDSEGNLCPYCEGKYLRMSAENSPEFGPFPAKIDKSTAIFKPFPLEIPVGEYSICVALEASKSLTHRFRLVVEHGAYPTGLKLLDSEDLVVALEGENVSLPTMKIRAESASGAKVNWRKVSVGLKIESMEPMPIHMQAPGGCEILGTPVDYHGPGSSQQDDTVSSSRDSHFTGSSRMYEFRDVSAPTVAGNYSMKYFIRGLDVEPQHRRLEITHGRPSRLVIVRGPSGQPLDVLQVNLLDDRKNKCHSVSGIDIGLSFDLNEASSMDITRNGLPPCSLDSRRSATVVNGKADFGPFRLTDGFAAIYKVKVFPTSATVITGHEVQIFVTRGEPTESIKEELHYLNEEHEKVTSCATLLSQAQEQVHHRSREQQFLSDELRNLREDKAVLLHKLREVQEEQRANADEALLDGVDHEVVRGERELVKDLYRLGQIRYGNNVPILLLEAQREQNFLNPETELGRDIVGLVALLARVECRQLNRALVEFLGSNTMLLIVCRTQKGVNALEQYHRNNEIDETKGLHGFARSKGKVVSRRFECIALSDIRPYRRHDGRPHVIQNHPQELLDIDPPVLPSTGLPPKGFLGYAVNLLHLKDEYLGRMVHSTGTPLNLRETLFYFLFQNLQVYDNRQNMLKAKDNIRLAGGAISLDGGFIRKNLRQQLGKRSEGVSLSFANVDKEERLVSGLMPPACHAFERLRRYSEIAREIKVLQEGVAAKERELSYCEEVLKNLNVGADEVGSECDFEGRIEDLKRRLEEITKVEKLFLHYGEEGRRALNKYGRNEKYSHELMRAFIM
ncbi:hypothetical protein R1sor_001653 [Riccia sorocarpa]|uniref:Structural maintenance of chromosomes flexible hinge domain-containing protein 1 n=1 Tax=Riccia sorocarpa TaxID=122646 RepID=A0ABD3GY59_9MARC